MANSIYEEIGGAGAIGPLVMSFYDKVVESSSLRHFFDNVDMQRLVDHQAKYIASILGGPSFMTPDELRAVHTILDISDSHFNEMMKLFREALDESNLTPTNSDLIAKSMEVMRPNIVC